LWVAAVNGVSRPKPDNGQRKGRQVGSGAGPEPKPEEGLRLITAFSRIDDPLRRAELIERAERYQAERSFKPGA
jgi:hypothetical protein